MWLRNIFNPIIEKLTREKDGSPTTETSPYLSAQSVRQLDRLQLSASRYLPGYMVGMRPSLRRKPAADFREHRMYVAGDDIRFIDWKASARQEHIFVKQGEYPKEVTVYILIDCSASMTWGDPPKSTSALSLATALGYLALAHGDRLAVYPISGKKIQPLGPISGKGQIPTLLNYLRKLPFRDEANFGEELFHFSRHATQGGRLTFIISDLLGVKELNPILQSMPAPTWDVTIFHLLHPEELRPTYLGDFEMKDIESSLAMNYDITPSAISEYGKNLDVWRNNLEMACIENNVFYSLIPSNWSLESEVIPHLRAVNIARPL